MLFDTVRRGRSGCGSAGGRPWLPWRLDQPGVLRRLGWGVADQAMSSISNFAVNIYIARTLGAVQYGAFGLAYVTYGFALNASRGLATDPLLVRFSGTDLPTWRRAVASCTGTAAVVGLAAGRLRARGRRAARRHGQAGLPRPRTDAARADAAGQLAIFVLRAWTRRPGVPQRHDLGGGAASRPGAPAADRPRERLLVRLRVGRRGTVGGRHRTVPGPGPAQAAGRGGGCRGTATSGPATSRRAPPTAPRPSCATTASASSWAWPLSATCRPPAR